MDHLKSAVLLAVLLSPILLAACTAPSPAGSSDPSASEGPTFPVPTVPRDPTKATPTIEIPPPIY